MAASAGGGTWHEATDGGATGRRGLPYCGDDNTMRERYGQDRPHPAGRMSQDESRGRESSSRTTSALWVDLLRLGDAKRFWLCAFARAGIIFRAKEGSWWGCGAGESEPGCPSSGHSCRACRAAEFGGGHFAGVGKRDTGRQASRCRASASSLPSLLVVRF